nr:hypothetical protein [Tanacetum cinerariifolium]
AAGALCQEPPGPGRRKPRPVAAVSGHRLDHRHATGRRHDRALRLSSHHHRGRQHRLPVPALARHTRQRAIDGGGPFYLRRQHGRAGVCH